MIVVLILIAVCCLWVLEVASQYPNILLIGSTRSGKSMAECRRLVEAAQAGVAIVCVDPHPDSLASTLFEHLVARGCKKRILFDRLSDLNRVLGYDFLPRPRAGSPLEQLNEIDELVRSFTDVLCRRRQIETLATAPQTEEWVTAALMLYLYQRDHPPLWILNHAFGPSDHPNFLRLLNRCTHPEIAAKFRGIQSGDISRNQYLPAERIIRGVCSSPAFAARCGTTFDLPAFLDRRGILLIEGGGGISDDAQRTIFGSVILHTIRYVRTRRTASPQVILALDEANNAGLIGASGFETRAAAECQKMKLAIHVLVQSLNFPTNEVTESLLTNCLRHEWFFSANEAVIRKAAADLGSKDYEPELRALKTGVRYVKERTRVFSEYVPLLENPWGYPSLPKRKAKRALEEIRTRPEYHTPKVDAGRFIDDSQPREEPPPPDTTPPSPEPNNPNLGI